MNKFEVDEHKCEGCGLCESRCYPNVISVNGKAKYNDSKECVECFQCISICPNNAISFRNTNETTIEVSDREMDKNPVLSRRSCRFFKQQQIDNNLLAEIINGANMAPRFDISFKERKFIVINEKEKLNDIRNIVLGQIKKTAKLFGILKRILVLPKSKREKYKSIQEFFDFTLEINKTKEKLFHGAPGLVMITGPKSNVCSIDNSLYSMAQLLILAESKNLGSCINGFVSFFSKPIEKYLNIPNDQKIFTAAVIGHPAKHFNRYVKRNDTLIEWY